MFSAMCAANLLLTDSRSLCGATVGDNDLYVAGGDHFGASVCSMYKWSPEDNHFEDMAAMQIARKQWVLWCHS